jgi:hypothetical protein
VELREALSQIAAIRASVAATERFRGYRALPVALSGGFALLAAALQPHLVPDPAADLGGYLALWLTTAVLGAAAAGVRIAARDWFAPHPLTREVTRLAVGQFAPCLAAGLLVTVAVGRHAPHVGWALPGVWQVLFAMGVFASCRLLPRPVVWVGVFYLLCGTANLAFGHGPAAFGPWAMGLPFGVGQLVTAAVLYWHLERNDGGD